MSIDPGRTSGYTYGAFKDQILHFHPFQMTDDVDDLWHRLVKFKPLHIIIEDFEFRGGARKGLDLYPVELIGVTKLFHALSSNQLYVQKAATGKSYYSDNKLKGLGLYQRGLPHGMDATRHLLQWATFGAGYQFCRNNVYKLVGMDAFNLQD